MLKLRHDHTNIRNRCNLLLLLVTPATYFAVAVYDVGGGDVDSAGVFAMIFVVAAALVPATGNTIYI